MSSHLSQDLMVIARNKQDADKQEENKTITIGVTRIKPMHVFVHSLFSN